MKRHQTLQDLSREHHTAHTLALAARRAATSGDPRQVLASATACAEVFATHLEPHFVVEETTLLPAMAEAGEGALVERTLREHAALRELVQRLSGADASDLLGFADLLSAHVRFEERELFEMAQATLYR